MYSKILVPSDGSPNALRAAECARDLVKLNPSARVTILFVHHVIREYHYYKWGEVAHPASAETMAKVKATEEDVLGRTRKVFEAAGIAADTKVVLGSAPDEVVALAKSGGFDLIVMGSRGLSEVVGLLMGSVSERVVHLATCPVMIVK